MTATPFDQTVRRHGGRLAEAVAAWPDAPTPWIDLSTGINPRPWAGDRATAADLARLPDPQALRGLEAAAAAAFGVTDLRRVAATPGAEVALRLLPALLNADTIAIASPTYGSHAAAWSAAGAWIHDVADDWQASDADVLLLVNPNNPDGRTLSREAVIALASARQARGGWTVVDESFVEVEAALSVADVALDRLLVLRSFGKVYGLPGVRLGFLLAAPPLVERLRSMLGDWPVGADAVVMGTAAYQDPEWREQTATRLAAEAASFDQDIVAAGLTIVGGTSLFRLVESPDAGRLFERLCARGILSRPFTEHPRWLRLGLPPADARERVATALREAAA